MGKWFGETSKDIYRKHGKEAACGYLDSAFCHGMVAVFYAELVDKQWKDQFSRSFVVGDGSLERTVFICNAHTVSYVNAVNSVIECLAQLINATLLSEPFPEGKVYPDKVESRLSREQGAEDVYAEYKLLLNSDEYKYLNAFWNISKHRRMIQCDFHAEFGESARNQHELLYTEFIFGDVPYPETLGNLLLVDYRQTLWQRVIAVGTAIDTALDQRPV